MSLEFLSEILDEIKKIGFFTHEEAILGDFKFYTFQKYQIIVQLILKKSIEIDFYAELTGGIYETGDISVIANKMGALNELSAKFKIKQINTTERLYPHNRRGRNTNTSGL